MMSQPQIRMKTGVGLGMALLAVAFYVGWRGGYMPVLTPSSAEKTLSGKAGQTPQPTRLVDAHSTPRVVPESATPESRRVNPVRRVLKDEEKQLKQKADQRFQKVLSQWELSRTRFTRSETPETSQVIAVITAPTVAEVDALAAEMAAISQSLSGPAKTFFDVESAKKLEDFTNFQEDYKVAIRVLDTHGGGEQHWYYEFNPADPSPYGFTPNGALILPPGIDPILNRKEWHHYGRDYERLAHLFPISGED